MTLPSKNRRNLSVDGHDYHWVFNPIRLAGKESFIVVQSATGNGPKLLMQWVGLALPRFVAEAIRFAGENGWHVDGSKSMEIGCDSYANPTAFSLRPEDGGRHWFHDWWHERNPGHMSSTPLSERDVKHWK